MSDDGKLLTVRPDQHLAGDDDALSVPFVSSDDTGKHEMLRSFIGQKVKITVEVED